MLPKSPAILLMSMPPPVGMPEPSSPIKSNPPDFSEAPARLSTKAVTSPSSESLPASWPVICVRNSPPKVDWAIRLKASTPPVLSAPSSMCANAPALPESPGMPPSAPASPEPPCPPAPDVAGPLSPTISTGKSAFSRSIILAYPHNALHARQISDAPQGRTSARAGCMPGGPTARGGGHWRGWEALLPQVCLRRPKGMIPFGIPIWVARAEVAAFPYLNIGGRFPFSRTRGLAILPGVCPCAKTASGPLYIGKGRPATFAWATQYGDSQGNHSLEPPEANLWQQRLPPRPMPPPFAAATLRQHGDRICSLGRDAYTVGQTRWTEGVGISFGYI